MKIYLTQGQVAIVDDEIADEVNKYLWYANYSPLTKSYYAARQIKLTNESVRQRMCPLHRFVWLLVNGSIPDGYEIDHIDNDTLNCQLENLRLATHRQNLQNLSGKTSGKYTSIYPGVSWSRGKSKWRARITIDGKEKFLGYFDDELEAFHVYCDTLTTIGEALPSSTL